MALPLDAIWLAVLLLILAIFCIAYLISPNLFGVLILVAISIGLIFTPIALFKKRQQRKRHAKEEGILLEYLRSHGIGGELSEIAERLGLTQEKASKLLLSLEEQGLIPSGSARGMLRKP